jgi:hypothetical protein
MNAPTRTEREAARRDFEIAPATQATAVLPFPEGCSIGKSTGHGPGSAHKTFLA